MRKLLASVVLLVSIIFTIGTNIANANVTCSGKINNIYKYDWMATFSVTILMDNGQTTPWISMPSKDDEAMALMAFASDKPVTVSWFSSDVTACSPGSWAENRVLSGYLMISK